VTTVVIADDHPVVRRGLCALLSTEDDVQVIGEVGSGADILGVVQTLKPTILLLDVSMPGSDFFATLASLRDECPEVYILVVSSYPEDLYARRAFRLGAAGYLSKDRSSEELLDAVRKVARGEPYLSRTLVAQLTRDLLEGRDTAPHERLTNREYQVLLLLVAGVTVTQIASALELSVKTVSTHRERLLRKMGLKTNAELVTYAVQHALRERS
jgi:DNA-binding NarL/FixJ family response regulator